MLALNESLTNENNESFNFGYLNGVRGFFTDPSRADDSFVPFSSFSASYEVLYQKASYNGESYSGTYTVAEDCNLLIVTYAGGIASSHATVKVIYNSEEILYTVIGDYNGLYITKAKQNDLITITENTITGSGARCGLSIYKIN